MSRVPGYEQRLKALVFKGNFQEKIDEMKEVRYSVIISMSWLLFTKEHLTFYHANMTFNKLEEKAFDWIVEKGVNGGNNHFLTMFSSLQKTTFLFLITVSMSFVNVYNLVGVHLSVSLYPSVYPKCNVKT